MTRNYVPTKKLADLDLNSELNQFDLNLQSKRDKAISVADYRSERGEVVAAILGKAAADAGDLVCSVYAERLKACADRNNYYYGEDFLDNSTGETFCGFSNLFGCGLKLCQNCVARSAAKHRSIARQAIKNTKLIKRENYHFKKKRFINELERYRFVTFTMPEFEASFVRTMAVQKRAWDLFRKLKFTKRYFSAYIKSIEFTIRKNLTIHDHIHLLAISIFVPEELIKIEWTKCVKAAFAEFGIEFTAKQANVNLQLVVSKVKPGEKETISLEDALQETCKYVTKSDSWEKLPAEHLLEVARIPRWARMFEVAGRFRETIKEMNASSSSVGEEASLKEAENLANANAPYFNTDVIIDGELLKASEISKDLEEISTEKTEKSKRVSWRDLVLEIGRENYLEIFYRQVEYARKIRKLRLIIKFPDAKFSDLAGNAWDLTELEQFAQQLASRGIELGI
jgi:hypothetical protein